MGLELLSMQHRVVAAGLVRQSDTCVMLLQPTVAPIIIDCADVVVDVSCGCNKYGVAEHGHANGAWLRVRAMPMARVVRNRRG